MLDAIVISDVHLDSENCQGKRLVHLLEKIGSPRWQTRRLILNGDIFDNLDHRLPKSQWKILSILRRLSDQIEIIWVLGNHDAPVETIEFIAQILDVVTATEWTIESGGRRILFVHGDEFDDFIDAHPFLTRVGDGVYGLLQKVDQTHEIAKQAKRRSKAFLRCVEKVRSQAIDRARARGCGVVCCGHTHHAETWEQTGIEYYNSGCWTELPGTFLTVRDGRVRLQSLASDKVAL